MFERASDHQVWAAHPDALALVSDGVLVDTNPSTEHLYGYRRSWLVGRSADVLAPLGTLSPGEPSPLFAAARVDGRSFVASATLVTAAGSSEPALLVIRDLSSLVGLPDGSGYLDANRETVTQYLFGAGLELLSSLEQEGCPSREPIERALGILDEAMRVIATDR
ncbi:MAG: hypothetical protein ACR2QO_15910 [Acidimicrobiales bacterium]